MALSNPLALRFQQASAAIVVSIGPDEFVRSLEAGQPLRQTSQNGTRSSSGSNQPQITGCQVRHHTNIAGCAASPRSGPRLLYPGSSVLNRFIRALPKKRVLGWNRLLTNETGVGESWRRA